MQKYRFGYTFCVSSANVLSEICLPIFVSGRLVGTMNLESAYKDAYSETLHLARAIAEQVGLSLSHSRQVIEDVIWSRTANLTVNTHELLKCVSKLQELADSTNTPIGDKIKSVSNKIRKCIDGGDSESYSSPMATLDIVTKVIEELNYGRHIHWKKEPVNDYIHLPLRALAIKLAFTMILDNAYNEALRSNDFKVLLSANESMVGNVPYLSVKIENAVLSKLHDNIAHDLYRMPIQRSRVHIGAFAAGAAMRAIGGDVYLAINDGRILKTVIDIPIKGAQSP